VVGGGLDGCDGSGEILSNVVLSQIADHAPYGGVVPEIAARAHLEALDGIVEKALADASVTLSDLDGIAVTSGPGLAGGLIVGTMTARALAAVADKPLYTINHLEGHALTAPLPFPPVAVAYLPPLARSQALVCAAWACSANKVKIIATIQPVYH